MEIKSNQTKFTSKIKLNFNQKALFYKDFKAVFKKSAVFVSRIWIDLIKRHGITHTERDVLYKLTLSKIRYTLTCKLNQN